MRYRIEHESNHRIRIRLYAPEMTQEQAQILQFAFSSIAGVRKVTIYRQTVGCAIEYDGEREQLLEKLDAFQYENVTMLADTVKPVISAAEMRDRKLDPALKRKLRTRILVESVADLVLPMPLQIGYHAYQMITLRDV